VKKVWFQAIQAMNSLITPHFQELLLIWQYNSFSFTNTTLGTMKVWARFWILMDVLWIEN
jgi:hypothetical protein